MGIGRSFVIAVLSLVCAAGTALAGEGKRGSAGAESEVVPAQAAAGAAAEVKFAKAIENREPVDESTSFAAGEKVWAWSRITGANGTTIRHVWKKDGKDVWAATLQVKSDRWTTYSRRTVQPGQYEVAVVAQDGTTLGSASFMVQ